VVLSAFVENEPGVLADVTGLFSRRQINIKRIVGEPEGSIESGRFSSSHWQKPGPRII